jgi:alkanesulfonate monooxygenase SsuD/methylene tetrahydromethanopterin reductase-like flavin-dependent oxidoreductase (luciferase family)
MSIRLAIRFDMRAPDLGAPAAALYPAAVELCAYADSVGFDTVYLAEHHGADDGYCASPLVLAGAIAGRTSRMRLHLSALIAVLHHPLRLAEDLATLDLVSGGRVEMTMGIGYRLHEYEMFGIEKRRRAPLLEDIIEVLTKAWTGEPFDFRGTTVVVRPVPVQVPRPPIYIGGSTEASAMRAARVGDNYLPAMPGLYPTYVAERQRLGLPVPPPPRPKGPLFLHVTDDPERAWHDVAPHVIYTSNSNAEWAKERGVGATPYPPLRGVDDLKASPQFAVVTPQECVELIEGLSADAEVGLQPLMGGLDPDVGSASLELLATRVLPALERSGRWVRGEAAAPLTRSPA